MRVQRRTAALIVALLAGGAANAATASARQAERGGGTSGTVTVSQGTDLAVAAAPGGRTLVMDLQGVLWRLPATGGTAIRLTRNIDDAAVPDWSPDGRTIAYQSYRTGNYHVWTVRPDGSARTALTSGPYDDREPVWSPDGTRIAFSSDRAGGTYDIWVLDVATGRLTRWTSGPDQESQPTWSPDGKEIAYVVGKTVPAPTRAIGALAQLSSTTVQATDGAGHTRTLVTEPSGTITSPSWGPDGTSVAYVLLGPNQSTLKVSGRAITEGEDVFPFRPEWLSSTALLYSADGGIRRRDLSTGQLTRVPFTAGLGLNRPAYDLKRHAFDATRAEPVRGIVSPVLAPDGRHVVFIALNDLWEMRIGGRPRRLTDDRYLEADPAWSPDGAQLAYSSDRAGSEDVYVRDVRSGATRRVTSAAGAEAHAAFSPDGRQLAYQDEKDATYALDLASGAARQVVPPAWEPGAPTWGPNGATLAIAALKPFSDRFREGTSQVLAVDAASGQQRWIDPIPFASLSNRVTSGPVWSPDGRSMALVIASRLYTMPVDASGTPTAAPRRVTDEVAESPSWGDGSRELLYQSNGRLRIVPAGGGAARTVEVPLRWRRSQPRGRQVIHAGALWDGVRRTLRRNVDIVLDRNRIVRVAPHRAHRRGPVIDASGLTVMPGLWDAHVHQELDRSILGSRQTAQQLAFGITTTMSMGDPVYEVTEDQEALSSGARIGPRLFTDSEPVDGSRIYYDFMRPTRDMTELRRELSRIGSMDPDILKTYVRLPYDRQRVAIAFAHRLGLPAFSHYWFPPVAFGQDGISHITATQRLGFSRTQSPSGFAYDDIIRSAARSKMSMTSTLFASTTLLADDPGLVADPRVTTLYTPFQLAELKGDLDTATGTDQTQTRIGLQRSVGILKAILDRGGRVLAGTDIPLDPVAVDLHLNLRAMVRYGMSPYEALQTATRIPARQIGVSRDLGSVRPGMLADLAFVRGNPLRRIDDAADVRMVMTDGRLRTVDSLLARYPKP
jgi:Tol biopolymer transport system component